MSGQYLRQIVGPLLPQRTFKGVLRDRVWVLAGESINSMEVEVFTLMQSLSSIWPNFNALSGKLCEMYDFIN